MPDLGDDRFERSVILLCAHSPEGAMGLMVNLPSDDVTFGELCAQLELDIEGQGGKRSVYSGGPVEGERGFVLHSNDYNSAVSTMPVTPDIAMTATLDVIEDLASGTGPRDALVMLGYCGWGAGQLEQELSQNAWLLAEGTADLVFHSQDARKWERALAQQGISALALSSSSGRA